VTGIHPKGQAAVFAILGGESFGLPINLPANRILDLRKWININKVAALSSRSTGGVG